MRSRAGGDDDPYTTSFRGIDNPTYYMTDTGQYVQLLNFSGCGNTTNANNPIMKKLIIDSLRMCAAQAGARAQHRPPWICFGGRVSALCGCNCYVGTYNCCLVP